MNKIKKIMICVAIFAITLLSTTNVFAATLTKVTYSDSKIKVEGTATRDQVQVIVFDLTNKPLYLATVDVKNDAFSKTLDATFDLEENKTYTIKVADYDGTGVSSKTFVVAESDGKDDTPKTGEKVFIAVATIATVVLATKILYAKKAKANN